MLPVISKYTQSITSNESASSVPSCSSIKACGVANSANQSLITFDSSIVICRLPCLSQSMLRIVSWFGVFVNRGLGVFEGRGHMGGMAVMHGLEEVLDSFHFLFACLCCTK